MFIEFFRHLDQNYKKKEPSDLDKGKKYEKSHMLVGKSVSRKKNETPVEMSQITNVSLKFKRFPVRKE